MGSSLIGGYEIIENILMPLAVFPALAIAQSSGIIPRIDIFVSKLSNRFQYLIHLFLVVIEIIIYSMLTVYGWQSAWMNTIENASFSASGMLIPIYPFLYLAALGFGLLVIENLFILIKSVIDKKVIFSVDKR